MSNPLVTVVIPTFNSEKFLERCLLSVKNQTYSNLEIIVIDNYSVDGTRKIAENYADLFLIKGPERSAQLNFGVRHAQGVYVYRVDSDFVLERNVIEEAVMKCNTELFDAVCVHNTSDDSVGFWAKVRKMERDCYKNDKLNVAARFFRKAAFEKVGGFNEEMVIAEDYDLHNRLVNHGFNIGYIVAQEIHLGEPNSLREIVQKHYYYGQTLKQFLGANPVRGSAQISPLRHAFIKNKENFLKHPSLTVGFLFYQLTRYLSAGIGYLMSELT